MRRLSLLFIFLLLTSCGGSSNTPESQALPEGSVYTIRYVVTGAATDVDIRHNNNTKGMNKINITTLPWEATFSFTVAEFNNEAPWVKAKSGNGSLNAQVFLNDTLLKYESSTGPISIVEASYDIFGDVMLPVVHPPHTIKYVVTGDVAPELIIATNETGGDNKYQNVSLPWEVSFETTRGKEVYFYIGASNHGGSGYLKAEVYVDGVLVNFSETAGDSPRASAGSRIP